MRPKRMARIGMAYRRAHLPDGRHMVAGVRAGLLVARRVTDDGHVSRRGAHHFAHATPAIADNDDGRRQ